MSTAELLVNIFIILGTIMSLAISFITYQALKEYYKEQIKEQGKSIIYTIAPHAIAFTIATWGIAFYING